MSKRKGSTEEDYAFMHRSVVVSPPVRKQPNMPSSWENTRQQLVSLRQSLPSDDPIQHSLQRQSSRLPTFEHKAAQQSQKADTILEQLHRQMEAATATRQQESLALQVLQTDLVQLTTRQQQLAAAIQDGCDQQHELRQQIADCQHQIETAMAGLSAVQEDKLVAVPRLRHQLSLYAACTGVKWDFGGNDTQQQQVLAGEMVSSS